MTDSPSNNSTAEVAYINLQTVFLSVIIYLLSYKCFDYYLRYNKKAVSTIRGHEQSAIQDGFLFGVKVVEFLGEPD